MFRFAFEKFGVLHGPALYIDDVSRRGRTDSERLFDLEDACLHLRDVFFDLLKLVHVLAQDAFLQLFPRQSEVWLLCCAFASKFSLKNCLLPRVPEGV